MNDMVEEGEKLDIAMSDTSVDKGKAVRNVIETFIQPVTNADNDDSEASLFTGESTHVLDIWERIVPSTQAPDTILISTCDAERS